jgi:hypothetical protein
MDREDEFRNLYNMLEGLLESYILNEKSSCNPNTYYEELKVHTHNVVLESESVNPYDFSIFNQVYQI